MIASYFHNFIFIKTKKTGSTTAEVVLAATCGPNDIITPLGRRDELERGNGNLMCRNFAFDPKLEQEWREAIVNEPGKLRRRKGLDFRAHMPATEIKDKLPPEFWESACKITVERHPYEKAISRAFFTYSESNRRSFAEHCDRIIRHGNYTCHQYYMIDGKVVVDEIMRQESLATDLKRIGAKLGIPIPDPLPRMKSHTRTDNRPARDILSDEQKEIIYGFCKVEFDLLGYER